MSEAKKSTTMDKLYYTLLLMLLGSITMQAQDSGCKPLVREGVVWHYAYEDFEISDIDGLSPDPDTYHIIDQKMQFRGDTTIWGITYKKCYFYETEQMASDERPVVLAREDNGKAIFAPTVFNQNAYASGYFFHPLNTLAGPYASITGEYVVYDFGDIPGFLAELQAQDEYYVAPELMSVSTTVVGSDSVRCYKTNWGDSYVESVGIDGPYSGYLDDPFPERPTCICPGVKGLIMLTDLEGNMLYEGTYYNEYSGIERMAEEQHNGDTLWYNLMGQPFDSRPSIPGVYIHGGRKVLVK